MAQKILVVDDKPFMTRLIQHHLQKAGYTLIQARNKKEAVEAMARETPDLVVVDDSGNLPDTLQPNELLSANGSDLPVIRMTDDPKSVDGDSANGEVVLSKPFSPSKLVAEIKRLANESGTE